MALADVVIPTESLSLPGGQSVQLRGLGINDLQELYEMQGLAMDFLTSQFQSETDPKVVATLLLREAPELAFNAIALAAGEPDQAETVSRLPLVTQIEALVVLYRLTVTDEAALKKLGGHLIDMLSGLTTALASSRQMLGAVSQSTG